MERSIQEPSEEIPFGMPENKQVHYRLMYDLLALAFEGDLTRSATFMLGKDLSGASFPDSGFNGGWHGSSHHGDKPDNVAKYAKINRYHVENLAYFAEKLSKTPDGDGTLLDHILIYKGSNMGNSHRHAHVKVPVILLGGLDGKFKGNRHIVFPDNTERTSNMLLALLHKYGIAGISQVRCQRQADGHCRDLRFQHQADIAMSTANRAARHRDGCALLLLAGPAAAQTRRTARGRKSNGPMEPVWEVIRNTAPACHGIDDYAFYALDRAAWQKLIARQT